MEFSSKLQEGVFLRRYKRFFADIQVGDQTIVAHVPNTGSMKGLNQPGCPCRFSHHPDPARKLHYTLQMVRPQRAWVGINTGLANGLVREAWEEGRIAAWQRFERAESEIKISDKTRLDMVLWQGGGPVESRRDLRQVDFGRSPTPFHFVEIKSVTLAEGDWALFPDAVSVRAQKHLAELVELIEMGHSAELVLAVQRADCKRFRPADLIDPEYGRLLRAAAAAGVALSAYPCRLRASGIVFEADRPLPIELD